MNNFRLWIDTHITLHSHDDQKEEKLNSITHAVGAVAAAFGLILMLIKASSSRNPSAIWGAGIFCFTLLLMFTGSALYHYVKPSTAKRLLRFLDHSNIYFLIAGSYTPVCFSMTTNTGPLLLAIIWGLVAAGLVFSLIFWGRLRPLHIAIYLVMGWLIVFFWKDFTTAIPSAVIPWIIGGGLFYTVGVVFYAMKRIPHNHAIWHLFVIGGGAAFYLGFYLYLL